MKWIGQLEGQSFCQDPHCGDILVFPAQLKAQLNSTKLLSDHKLIIQVQATQREEFSDKGSLLSVNLNMAVEICAAPSIFTDIYDFTLVTDLLPGVS